MSFFEQLKQSCATDWQAYTQHEFVRQLGAGTLSAESFKHYLKQDYLFLIQFTRAWSLAVYKSDNFADMRYGQAGINALLDLEIGLHIDYCKEWGISEQQLLEEKESSACVAYTRFVLDRGLSGDLAELHAALAPCMMGYAEIGSWLMEQPFTKLEGNPYRKWIDMYASKEFQDAISLEKEVLERLCADLPESWLSRVKKTFGTATRMEVAFWDMGLQRLL